MKKLLLFLFLSTAITFSQKNEKFKAGVHSIVIKKQPNYTAPKSVLFVFTGHTHLINFYLDLSKKIRKRFKKDKVKIAFNFNLSGGNLEQDLKLIPKKNAVFTDFEAVCRLKMHSFKGWDGPEIKKRKQVYNLEIRVNEKRETVLRATLDVKTFFTIATQNKALSKKIYRIISSK